MKENQRVSVTKRMLKEGLLRLLNQKPLEKIHVNELCRESGINRATFYRHYEAPQDILGELEQDMADEFLVNIPRQTPKTMQEAQKTLETLCDHIYKHADVYKVLFQFNSDEDIRRKVTAFYKQLLDSRKGERQFTDVDEETSKLIVTMYGGGCYCLLRYWIMYNVPKTPKEIAAILCTAVPRPHSGDFPI